MSSIDFKGIKRPIALGTKSAGSVFSLPAFQDLTGKRIDRLPRSIRIILESVIRAASTGRAPAEVALALADWSPGGPRTLEIPFYVGRAVLQDIAGIPLLGDLAALRDAMAEQRLDPTDVSPKIPTVMVIDHTLTIDHHIGPDAMALNMREEIERNAERFSFVKWAASAMPQLRVVPPGVGILHQVNLEQLSSGILQQDGLVFPDTLIGTDSHTCMISGLGVMGWGVGGIEAVAALLGEPIALLEPDVVGIHVTGQLRPGVTATDLVLTLTKLLRSLNVVGKFIEFFGPGLDHLTVPDRATIANMAPEYGATVSYFPVDQRTLDYYAQTGRPAADIAAIENYFRAQDLFGSPVAGEIDYSQTVELDLDTVEPVVAGPSRPQDLVPLSALKASFSEMLHRPAPDGGMGVDPLDARDHGAIAIAAITSCTNTSNPALMVAAGLLARNALRAGLTVPPWTKTSMAPGSRAVTAYLERAGLLAPLATLGFDVVGFGCATCIGNSGPLTAEAEHMIVDGGVIASAVLSGNRNFEARIHPLVRTAYLASPPLVVAFALAGTVNVDFNADALGRDASGSPVRLADLWPSSAEIAAVLAQSMAPEDFRDAGRGPSHPEWSALDAPSGPLYPWSPASTHINRPPFLFDPELSASSLVPVRGARALALFGDSVTTDHISPVSRIRTKTPAGDYLDTLGENVQSFGTFGERRLNHEVMVRGAFSNPRLRNLAADREGGFARHMPSGEQYSIYEVAMRYRREQVPAIVVAGAQYGTGSARDWAAKATRLLGVRAVVAVSFERIHRLNLIGMGVLPLRFTQGDNAGTLGLDGSERFSIEGFDRPIQPRMTLDLVVERSDGTRLTRPVTLMAEGETELGYLRAGGILQAVLTNLER